MMYPVETDILSRSKERRPWRYAVSQILLIHLSDEDREEIESVTSEFGLLVKAVSEPSQATKWLAVKKISLVLVHASFLDSLGELHQVMGRVRPDAKLMLYDFAHQGALSIPGKLSDAGISVALGSHGRSVFHSTLRSKFPTLSDAALRGKVLLVEDIDSSREILSLYLENYGFDCDSVSSGEEALRSLSDSSRKYFCVVTDLRMPGMSGYELIRVIRSMQSIKSIPIIAMSAFSTPAVLLDCLAAGVSSFLVKPPRMRELVRELQKARRIYTGLEPARLVEPQDVKTLKEILQEKGYEVDGKEKGV